MKLTRLQLDTMKELVKHELKESKSFYEKSDVIAVKRTLLEIWDELDREEEKKKEVVTPATRAKSRRNSQGKVPG